MTEREYQLMLDVVDEAINSDDRFHGALLEALPIAANDNQIAWPLTLFPEGWTASP